METKKIRSLLDAKIQKMFVSFNRKNLKKKASKMKETKVSDSCRVVSTLFQSQQQPVTISRE